MNIEVVYCTMIAEGTMPPKLISFFVDKESFQFYGYNHSVSKEFASESVIKSK